MSIPYNPNNNSFGEPQGTTDGTFITPILVGDEINGNTPQPTTDVSGNQVSAALEVQSTEGALLLPRMPTTDYQLTAGFVPYNGMILFDVTIGKLVTYENGSWIVIGSSSTTPQFKLEIFSTSGSGTWTVPTGVKSVKVTCVGAGAGGGGAPGLSGENILTGGGGGGGGTAIAILDLTGVSSCSYSVGANGNGGAAGGNAGTNGGNTTFTAGTFTVTANGGNGGGPGSTSPTDGSIYGGVGGSYSIPMSVVGYGIQGQYGKDGIYYNNSGSNASIFVGGEGGSGYLGVGAVQSCDTVTGYQNGNSGSGFGGGGAGGWISDSNNASGGEGSSGCIILEYLL